jgi:hypothetical protein
MRLPGSHPVRSIRRKNDSKNQGLFDFPMKTAAEVSWRCLNLKRSVAIFGQVGGLIIQQLKPRNQAEFAPIGINTVWTAQK